MAMPEVKRFPGFGIIYPDGHSGIRVVRTYTEAPKRIYNPDGSRSFTIPAPTIHEVFGGGFVYASGRPVHNRIDLERIADPNMRGRALKWFDGNQIIAKEATKGIPALDPEKEKEKPETVFVLSNDPGFEKSSADEIVRDLNDQQENPQFSQVITAIQALTEAFQAQAVMIKGQGEEIQRLKTGNSRPAARKAHKNLMKEKWKDPEFRAKMLKKNPIFKKKGEDVNGAAESSQAV